MSVTASLQATWAWLREHGVAEDSRPAPASPNALSTLSTTSAPAELLEFYAQQNGLPHEFILYGTWQFLTLEEAFELTGILIRSSAHLGEQRWNPAWLPILTNNGGDYCFQDLRQGDLAIYRHMDRERLPLQQSLGAFLERLVAELRAGEYVFTDDGLSYRGPRILGEGDLQVDQTTTAQRFVSRYLSDEYDLWVLAHTEPDDATFFRAAEAFEARYFGPELYSDVSRPGQLKGGRFAAFRSLLSAKQQRPLYGLQAISDGTVQAVLGSVDAGSAVRFELIRLREVDGELRIVSSYLTRFDGTFGHNGGEDAGETLPDFG